MPKLSVKAKRREGEGSRKEALAGMGRELQVKPFGESRMIPSPMARKREPS